MPAPKGHKAYNVNGEGGRPPIHTQEFIEKEADALEKWIQKPDSFFFKRFALERGYHPKNFSEWAKESKRFGDVYEKVQVWQETRLVEGGLLKAFDSGLTKFMLINKHGYAEKTETKVSGDSENPFACVLRQATDTSKDLVNG